MLVVGDVVGRDAGATAAMGQRRGVLRTLAHTRNEDGPAQVLSATERTARAVRCCPAAYWDLSQQVHAEVRSRQPAGGPDRASSAITSCAIVSEVGVSPLGA